MYISRALLAVVVGSCAAPAVAMADPAISVSSAPVGDLKTLPAKVIHRLSLTAGATPETVTVAGPGTLRVVGATPERMAAVPFPLTACAGRWQRPHLAYGGRSSHSETTFTIPPAATVVVETAVRFVRGPWVGDTLDASFTVTPASGNEIEVSSPAPAYAGPRGVNLRIVMTRRWALVYDVHGLAGGVTSGRATLFGYAPGRKRATRLGTTVVRKNSWSFERLRLPRAGRWEFYGRYETSGSKFTDDASACGVFKRIR